LWVGKPYGKYPAWKRDPLHNFSHGATTLQTARFYYLLETGRLVSKKRSQQMKQIMANPGTNHKFVKSLKKYRPGSKIYRKSGTWRTYHADSAIIERAGKTYIAVVLAQSRHGGNWIKRLIIHLDDMVFK
jgi:beta-lactamase class A